MCMKDYWLNKALELAKNSTFRQKHGAVIVKGW